MQLPSSPSPELPPIDAPPIQDIRHHLGGVGYLKEVVGAQVAEFGEGRYGATVDETKGLQSALETVDACVEHGNLVAGQATLEQAPRPRKLNEEVRDALVGLHQAERGEPTPDQRFKAINGLLLDVTKEIGSLTDPNKGNLHYTDPQVQARKDVEAAFKQRYHNYFDDDQPENDILQNGEQRTSHEVANDAYDLLLAYAEDKLRDPNVPPEKTEELRTARDTLHAERKNWKEQYEAQNEAVDAIMQLMGRDNEQFSEARIRAAARECVGSELSRLQELVATARETTDPVERFNLLNGVQQGNSPIHSAEAFDAWKQKRAEKAKAAVEQQTTAMANNAREKIEAMHGGVIEAEVAAAPAATPEKQEDKEAVIAPIPTGWTELVHGTDSTRWQHSGSSVEITGSGLSAISLEDIARGSGGTTKNYSRTRTGDGQPIEVRVSFYREDLSPRRGVLPDAAELKASLPADTLALIRKYHQDRHPLIPNGETLLKIGDSVSADNGRRVEHYVPRSVAEQYVAAVKRETGRDIVLPASVEQSAVIEQRAQQDTRMSEVVQPKSTVPEAAPQAPEQTRSPYEQFVKAALARVPQRVLLDSITAVAQEKLMDGQRVDINSLRQQLGQRLNGGLQIEPAKLEALARRVQQNGFYESGGGIWQVEGNSNTLQGQIAAEARRLVREIVSEALS